MPYKLRFCALALAASIVMPFLTTVEASDHGDAPILIGVQRHDARLTDLHVFLNGENLVLALSTFPNLPSTDYQFAPDLTFRLHIDNHSEVTFNNWLDNDLYGGTIEKPKSLGADIVLEFTFDEYGEIELNASGLPGDVESRIQVFAGVRDDPFIRGPQIGRNVAAIVVELPLADVLGDNSTILVWATSKVPDITGTQSELVGRALRSQCGQPQCLLLEQYISVDERNLTSPHKYAKLLNGLRPDVVIFDTSRPAGFPNGRLLTDDVVDQIAIFSSVGGQDITGNDSPFPSSNDVPFLSEFPYLAPPQ